MRLLDFRRFGTEELRASRCFGTEELRASRRFGTEALRPSRRFGTEAGFVEILVHGREVRQPWEENICTGFGESRYRSSQIRSFHP